MDTSERKMLRYLSEAKASEDALVRVLQSQIAMTPSGGYRSALDQHLPETRDHAARVGERLKELGERANPVIAVVGFWEDMFGQALAVSKTPLDMLRGSGGEDKILRNAKDAYAAEAWEIATYTAIERLARAFSDQRTAELARSILADEQRMLDRILREIPKLTSAVVEAEIKGEPSYDLATTGAGQAARKLADTAREATRAAPPRRRCAELAGSRGSPTPRARSLPRRTCRSPATTS